MSKETWEQVRDAYFAKFDDYASADAFEKWTLSLIDEDSIFEDSELKRELLDVKCGLCTQPSIEYWRYLLKSLDES